MLTKTNRWTFVLLATLLVAAWAVLPKSVSAAQTATPPTNSCMSCHEDLYYLHDTGKWYCITEHKDRCVNCHEGDASTLDEKASHKGLVAHPQQNNGEKCLECHPQDSGKRLATFANLGGYKTIQAVEPYVPAVAVDTAFPVVAETNALAENWPWAVFGVAAFGFWLLLVLISPMKP
jgi:nitrate reductase cytochrome c-type subunit